MTIDEKLTFLFHSQITLAGDKRTSFLQLHAKRLSEIKVTRQGPAKSPRSSQISIVKIAGVWIT